jgi:hypothetical protein
VHPLYCSGREIRSPSICSRADVSS